MVNPVDNKGPICTAFGTIGKYQGGETGEKVGEIVGTAVSTIAKTALESGPDPVKTGAEFGAKIGRSLCGNGICEAVGMGLGAFTGLMINVIAGSDSCDNNGHRCPAHKGL